MSALSSFISAYRPHGLKNKVAIKSPFGKRNKQEASAPAAPALTPVPSTAGQSTSQGGVIQIGDFNGRRSSFDFCDGEPSSPAQDRPLYTNRAPRMSTHLKLQLDLNPDTEPTDWFSGVSFPRSSRIGPHPQNGGDTVFLEDNPDDLVTEVEALKEGMKHLSHHGDVVASLQAMGPSDFGTLSREHPQNRRQEHELPPGAARPMSMVSSQLNSAVSGTTLARQLMGNAYVLSYDDNRRASGYQSVAGGGLARADSTTLGRDEHSYDYFTVDPNAPPVPSGAGAIYIPPQNPRRLTAKTLKRRGSTGSIANKLDMVDSVSPTTRPSSVIMSPTTTDLVSQFPSVPPSVHSDEESSQQLPPPERKHVPPAIDVTLDDPSSTSAQAIADVMSPTASDAVSPRNMEDVLDSYYSMPDHPEGVILPRGYRPVFTPITEESLWQLSPSLPSRNEKRESQRSQPIGARSPLKPSSRKRSLPTRMSANLPDTGSAASSSFSPLPAIPDRPMSVQITPSAPMTSSPNVGHRSNPSLSSIESADEPLADPPAMATMTHTRQRSGSAPSPIKVVHEPQDRNKYMLAIDDPAESEGPAPTTGESAEGDQFPQTALSLGWSATSSPLLPPDTFAITSPPPAAPDRTVSASFAPNNAQASLAQQILLARAQTTVRDRRSRQGSFSSQRKRSPSPGDSRRGTPELELEGNVAPWVYSRENVRDHLPPRVPPPKRGLPPSPGVDGHFIMPSLASTSSQERLQPPVRSSSLQYSTPAMAMSRAAARSSTSSGPDARDYASDSISINTQASTESGSLRLKSLPTVPPPPPSESTPSASPKTTRVNRNRAPPSLPLPEPHNTHGESSGSISRSNPPVDFPQESAIPLHSSASHHTARESTNTIDALLQASTSLGSPPPYYSVVNAQQAQSRPLTEQAQNLFAPLANSRSPHSLSPEVYAPSSLTRDPSIAGRTRLRPAMPAGPRRPGLGGSTSGSSPVAPATTRERSGSQSSLSGVSKQSNSRRLVSASTSAMPMSPQFQSPSVQWKGHTLEVAKWTFSSAQLQAIVSRAIKDSALSSSIRLLKLESIDGEIPDELHRLETHRRDVKLRYKGLFRRRSTLLESLNFHLTHPGEDSSTFAIRVVDELKELLISMDALTEDLHATDEQINQLNSLVQVHSASALSVALRKLNASLMKQKEDYELLLQQNIALEQERDEAWAQAQQIADEYDLNFGPTSEGAAGPSSQRSSRVSAKRKSSVRLSKAGLRAFSRRQSARSSYASNNSSGFPATPLSSSRSPWPPRGNDAPPPVPRIPKRRPRGLDIHEPALQSSGALSAADMTPDTGTREMVRVQEDLYHMLGISSPGLTSGGGRLKRSHSALGLPSAGLSPPAMSATFDSFERRMRRSSLPGAAVLTDAHNALDADHSAILFTFASIPDEE